VHGALVKAKLEPYLGFLHSTAYSKPSLVCDFLELYRYLAEDFLIPFCQDLNVGDFVMKGEWASGKKDRRGKRQYLSDAKTREMLQHLNRYLEGMVELPRISSMRYSLDVDRSTKALASLYNTIHNRGIGGRNYYAEIPGCSSDA